MYKSERKRFTRDAKRLRGRVVEFESGWTKKETGGIDR